MGAYDQASADLVAMAATIAQGDAQIALIDSQTFGQASLTGSAYAPATTLYQSAGQTGASSIGPEIDAAGSPAVTQPYTQAAWKLNAGLAAMPTSGRQNTQSRIDALAAGQLTRQMLGLYQQAVASGTASQAAPAPPAPSPAPTPAPSGGGGGSGSSSEPSTVQVASSALGWKGMLVAWGNMHPGAQAPSWLQWALAQAIRAEGSFTAYFRGTNCFGAMHASEHFAQVHANDPGYGMVAFLDHAPAAYISRMAVFPSMAVGALSYLKLIEAYLGTSSSPATISDYCARLYVHNYFGGFHTPRTPVSQRAAAYAAGSWLPADQANIADYTAGISAGLPAAQGAIASAATSTSDPTLPSSGVFAPLADRLTPGPQYAPHTLDHARTMLGRAADAPPPGAVSLGDCLSSVAGGEGIWMFGGSKGRVLPVPGRTETPAPAAASGNSAAPIVAGLVASTVLGAAITWALRAA